MMNRTPHVVRRAEHVLRVLQEDLAGVGGDLEEESHVLRRRVIVDVFQELAPQVRATPAGKPIERRPLCDRATGTADTRPGGGNSQPCLTLLHGSFSVGLLASETASKAHEYSRGEELV